MTPLSPTALRRAHRAVLVIAVLFGLLAAPATAVAVPAAAAEADTPVPAAAAEADTPVPAAAAEADTPVAIAAGNDGASWTVDSAGLVVAHGGAEHHGDASDFELHEPVVGMAASPSGEGYWLVASDGGVFTYGDARFHGSAGAIDLREPVVGMAASPSGEGYWLVASDGGVFTYGDAAFHGSAAGSHAAAVVGIAPTADGEGYWVATADSEFDSFGTAPDVGLIASAGTSVAAVATGPAGNLHVAFVEPDDDVVTEEFDSGIESVPGSDEAPDALDVAPAPPPSSGADPAPGGGDPTAADRHVAGLDAERLAAWDAMAMCESGGDWSIDTGNGYYGGLQFSLGTWRGVGGSGYPHHHDRIEQIYRGELLLESQGWDAWPGCARKLGLR